ncbi:MAG: hypothetical protein HYY62_05780 [Deltaproteobacteria bacterium]|nr:hypothetical protein [Deltaproteobacteria bacterium]
MRKILCFICLLLGSTAFASFQGAWRGAGHLQDKRAGSIKPCELVYYQFEQTEINLNLIKGGAQCEWLEITQDPESFKISNGKLYNKDGIEAGTISENELFIHSQENQNVYSFHFIKKPNGTLDYEEYVNISAFTYVLTAILNKR